MTETKIKVDGMHCHSCEMLIGDELGEITGVIKVEAHHHGGEVKITHEGGLDMGAVKKAIEGLGFKVK
jgi:copper chaperone CopZ